MQWEVKTFKTPFALGDSPGLCQTRVKYLAPKAEKKLSVQLAGHRGKSHFAFPAAKYDEC